MDFSNLNQNYITTLSTSPTSDAKTFSLMRGDMVLKVSWDPETVVKGFQDVYGLAVVDDASVILLSLDVGSTVDYTRLSVESLCYMASLENHYTATTATFPRIVKSWKGLLVRVGDEGQFEICDGDGCCLFTVDKTYFAFNKTTLQRLRLAVNHDIPLDTRAIYKQLRNFSNYL